MARYSSVWVPTLMGSFLKRYEGGVAGMWANAAGALHTINTEVGKYVEVTSVGAVTQWKGSRTANTPVALTLQLTNVLYQNGFDIDIDDVRRDNIGMYQRWATETGDKFVDHWNKLAATLLSANGSSTFDGNAFFASRTLGDSGSQTNLLTNSQVPSLDVTTAAAPTGDEMASAIVDTTGYMQTYLDEAGDPINGNAKGWMIISSNPKIITSARHAITADRLSSGQTNIVQGMESDGYNFRAVLEPRLGASNSAVFYFLRTDSEIKPLILQEETGIVFDQKGEESDFAVDNHKVFFGAHTLRSATYGRWQHASKCTLS